MAVRKMRPAMSLRPWREGPMRTEDCLERSGRRMDVATRRRQGRRRHDDAASLGAPRSLRYRHLVNPLARQPALSADRIEALHQTALKVLEELGMRVLNAEARSIYATA